MPIRPCHSRLQVPRSARTICGLVPVLAVAIIATAVWAQEEVASGIIDRERVAVIDGDSITIDGREWRLLGFDAPEFADAKCEGEHRAGLFAKRRLAELIRTAQRLEAKFSGALDRNKRALGDLLIDGRNVREIMIGEGYARPYTGGWNKGWCTPTSRHDLLPE